MSILGRHQTVKSCRFTESIPETPQELPQWWVRKPVEYKALLVFPLGLSWGCSALVMAGAASPAQPGGSSMQGGTKRAAFQSTTWA